MIKPAICYKEQLEIALAEYFYTDEMMYYQGWNTNRLFKIETSSECYFQWAIVDDKKNLLGYFAYTIDFYSSNVYNFGLFSFDQGNPIVGREAFKKLEELISNYHRLEFQVIGGNPAIRGYDKFLKRYSNIGKKHVFKDVFKDSKGNYHDTYTYEFINKK